MKYKVDGYFEFEGKEYVCEYHGCNFHGCQKCFPRDRNTTMNDNKSMEQRYRETKVKENRLRKEGFEVITKWSYDFAKDKNNPDVKKYINTLNIQDPINVRDCYFGGRTNGLVLHKIFTEGEKGYYVDFTSLYPDILKYRRFPVGHPERIERYNLAMHHSVTPFVIWQPTCRPHLLERVYKPIHTLHWDGDLQSLL